MSNKILYSPKEAQELANEGKAIMIDVGDTEDYAEEHIPGAVNISDMFYELSMTTKDGLREMTDKFRKLFSEAGISKDKLTIIYCFKGARAANTYVALKMAGFKNIRNYYGSWNEWSRDMSLPIDDAVLVA